MISYENEYPDAYRYIDVKDKVVLDIGADIGTSAKWFINQGAKKVICYSLDMQKISIIKSNTFNCIPILHDQKYIITIEKNK